MYNINIHLIFFKGGTAELECIVDNLGKLYNFDNNVKKLLVYFFGNFHGVFHGKKIINAKLHIGKEILM